MTIPGRPSGDETAGRLDSWKEIAAYLRRSDRSVRRWEKEEGLPIHRHPHSKRDSVYAYRAELDAWWASRGARVAETSIDAAAASVPVTEDRSASGDSRVEPTDLTTQDTATSGRPRFRLVAVGFAFLVLVVVGVVRLSRSASRARQPLGAGAFQARDWVLVADFENRTGEKRLDGALDYALMRELSNSRYVNVVSRDRVSDALRLMRKPPDTKIDEDTGRQICLRDGGIQALVTGRVERVGRKYMMTVEIVEPGPGSSVASFREAVDGDDDLLPATTRLSNRIRTTLGERAPLTTSESGLEKVTTPSLEALRLYSRADALMFSDKYHAAEELLRQALVEDPDFASAHMLLAFSIANQSRPRSEFLPEAERAFRLSDRTSDRERYFIRGGYYGFVGERDKEIAAYEALLSLYPDHYWAINNLEYDYAGVGRDLDAGRMAMRKADLRPKDFDANCDAAARLTRVDPDLGPEDRSRYAGRALALVSPEIVTNNPGAIVWLELLPARERWLAGDAAGALASATAFANKLYATPSLHGDEAYSVLGDFLMALGKLRAAEEAFRRRSDPNFELAVLSWNRGDRDGFRRSVNASISAKATQDYEGHLTEALLMARAGSPERAERELAARGDEPGQGLPDFLDVAAGEIDIARGHSVDGIRELKKSEEGHPRFGRAYFLWGLETLASALAREGDVEGAIRTLELGSRHKMAAVWMFNGGIWEHNQFLLARLYRQAGRIADAERTEKELRTLLAAADPDHPILVALSRTPPPIPASAVRQ